MFIVRRTIAAGGGTAISGWTCTVGTGATAMPFGTARHSTRGGTSSFSGSGITTITALGGQSGSHSTGDTFKGGN